VEEVFTEEAPGADVRQRWATEEGPRAIGEVAEAEEGARLCTRLEEFNRVLGGGIVAGSVVLLGGDPGIGKSTLIFQCIHGLAAQGRGASTSPPRNPSGRPSCGPSVWGL